jgi:hypothetical protein
MNASSSSLPSISSLPPALAAELRRLTEAELSLPARVGYVALLLVSAAMSAVSASLGLTEPGLPLRTRIAFAAMTAIGLGWVAFAAWVLTHKRILYARHRIVAGRMSVAFTAAFLAGSLVVGLTTSQRAAFAAAALGVVMLGVAIWVLLRARAAYGRLQERRAALERELGRA